MLTKSGVPSAVAGSSWPENPGVSGRSRSDKPTKTDAEREVASRERAVRDLSPRTDYARKYSRDGRPLPRRGFDAVPALWGGGDGARGARTMARRTASKPGISATRQWSSRTHAPR